MNAPDSELINAKIEATEARMEGRMEAVLREFNASMDGRFARIDDRFARMDARFDEWLARVDQRFDRMEDRISSLRTTIIVTGISTGLAVVLGIAGLNATIFSNMIAAFESGKETSASHAEIKRQQEHTDALLAESRRQLEQSDELIKRMRRELDAMHAKR